MVNTGNYKKYIAQGNLIMPNSLVGTFHKKDDSDFVCDIIMNDQKVDEAGFAFCSSTKFPDKSVIYITLDMFRALQAEDTTAEFQLYRELGHIECGHFDMPDDNIEMTDEEKISLVERQEIEADAFAAEFIGKENAISVLKELLTMRAQIDRDMNLNGTAPSVQRIRKFRARIKALEAL